MSFTHLHVHSHYSLLDGLAKIPDLVAHAKKQGMSHLALTDHGSMYGVIEFYQECQKQGIIPIIGAELYVAQRSLTDKQPKVDNRPYHLVVLAETYQGYKNLIKLISKAHLDGYYYKPRVDLELLEQYSEGLIGLSACLNGQVARTILSHEGAKADEMATEVIRKYQDIFGENNFFLEIQHNPTLPEQQILNAALNRLSTSLSIPLVATADSHYLTPEDAGAQDILICIQTKKQVSDEDRMSMRSEDYSLVDEAQMREWFPDNQAAVDQAHRIAERCVVELPLGESHLPHYELPAGKTSDQALRDTCIDGIEYRYGDADRGPIMERLDYELQVIAKTGYASYFLIVQDLVNWAKDNGIVVGPGRGSAAGSLVAYLCKITNIDPLKYDLLFERFLNPERVSMPDIDLDIADARRDEVIRYVESKYGKDHVAQIITFGTLAARAAVRDVGRAMGLSYGYCDMISKMIPMFTNLEDAMNTVPELKELYQSDVDASRLLDGARKLEGVVRHTSTHACGVIITKEPLEEYTPVQYSSSGDDTIVTQYSLHPSEDLGLLKMDFLGLKNLTIIENTINIIERTVGEKIDIDALPLDDKPSYQLLKKGHTTGIFQLESAGMKRYLRQLKPTEFEDVIAMVALYRPGPMERIPEYISGKHGKREVTYLHPKLEPILNKTYGILVYQEQVMQLVRDISGFTAGEGYLMIKAVGKKIKALLDEQENLFLEGCAKNGVSKSVAKQLWEFIEPFARYGFNKSHSTGYALIAYQTAYLKANYPAQFMASLLTSDQGDSDRVAIEVKEARELGIEVLSPDINESFSTFTVVKESLAETPRIRFGLAAVKNVGQKLVDAVIAERKVNGKFADIQDLITRVHHKDFNKKSLESLIKCGALDCLSAPEVLLNNVETLLAYSKQQQTNKKTGQSSLFGDTIAAPAIRLPAGEDIETNLKLQWEKQLLGLYITAHPMENIMKQLPAGIISIADAVELKGKEREGVRIVGIINTARRVITKNGDPMQFGMLEDATGSIEIIVFPKAMAEVKTVVEEGAVIEVTGSIVTRQGEKKCIVDKIEAFDTTFITLTLDPTSSRDMLAGIKETLLKFPGSVPVYVNISERSIRAERLVSPDVVPQLKELLGPEAVHLIY